MMRAKRTRDALERFLKAIEADTRNPRAYKLAGDCYLILGGVKEAAAAYQKSLEWNPQDSNLRGWLDKYAPSQAPAPNKPALPALPAPGAGAPAPAPKPAAQAPAPAQPVAAASTGSPQAAPATAAAPAAPSGMPQPVEGQ